MGAAVVVVITVKRCGKGTESLIGEQQGAKKDGEAQMRLMA